jgi:DnaK suppressor protein
VRNALQAVRDGTYGRCRRCKGSIAIERLEAQPDAVVCVKCAEQAGR